eukprot:gnl/TRDRNA2_/TRDRNA2_130048_c0_seq1.p1 gnl/TRDRNA2_/TRDRNA2_130048_c0~~gnl/TRDRNA2_/TRDRNA2_130048_c0_seq1.p1  ORF type:complete len:523 (-),score=89.45 gnl/TRDRNA2_/TRDRNA2_130048_c0_seq1:63-1631(-)
MPTSSVLKAVRAVNDTGRATAALLMPNVTAANASAVPSLAAAVTATIPIVAPAVESVMVAAVLPPTVPSLVTAAPPAVGSPVDAAVSTMAPLLGAASEAPRAPMSSQVLMALPISDIHGDGRLLFVVLALAIASNCVMLLAPLRPMLTAFRNKTGVELNGQEFLVLMLPVYMMFAQSYLWAFYGYLEGSHPIAHFNSFGTGVSLFYIYLISRHARSRKYIIWMAIGLVIGFSLTTYFTPSTLLDRERALAYGAILFNLLMTMAPVLQVATMIRTKSLVGFPAALTIAGFFNSIFWAQYSDMVHDRLYYIPNAFGTVAGAFQIAAMVWAASGSNWQMKPDIERQPLLLIPSKSYTDKHTSWFHWMPPSGASGYRLSPIEAAAIAAGDAHAESKRHFGDWLRSQKSKEPTQAQTDHVEDGRTTTTTGARKSPFSALHYTSDDSYDDDSDDKDCESRVWFEQEQPGCEGHYECTIDEAIWRRAADLAAATAQVAAHASKDVETLNPFGGGNGAGPLVRAPLDCIL